MKVVRPNCRWQFTAADVEFILGALGKGPNDAEALASLFVDVGSRDALLEQDSLHAAILEGTSCLQISPRLYFYVLVRRVLQRAGIADREIADYMAEFTQTGRTHASGEGGGGPAFEYFFEMMETLRRCDERGGFELRAHMGNLALFQSGLFIERIERRAARKGFPDVTYYEQIGESSFRMASRQRLATRLGLDELLDRIADCFHRLRLALNSLADRVFSWGEADAQVAHMLVRGG